MDVVFINKEKQLGTSAAFKYAARSLQKYMGDLGSIYIVGEMPEHARFAKHIPHKSIFDKDWQNQMHAVLAACSDKQITEEFLLVSTTTIMLDAFTGADYPFYRAKNGDGGPNGMYNFQLNCPIRINKLWFTKMPIKPTTKGDYWPRSFYCNFYRAPSFPADDLRLRVGKSMPSISDQLKNRLWAVLSNDTLADPEAIKYLEAKYCVPSCIE